MTSGTRGSTDVPGGRGTALGRYLLALAFWLAVWHLASVAVGQELLLVSPMAVLANLASLVGTPGFWATVWHSFARIVAGFGLALLTGSVLAILSGAFPLIRALVGPLILVVRSVPVVSFIILVLIWANSRTLSLVIAFLIALPVIHTNVLEGIDHRDPALREMARVFRIPWWRRFRAIDLPAVLPHLQSASRTAIGLAWKSGVAAEVIGLPDGSIGERLYQAKIFLSTAELFSWTIVIVLLSFTFEKAFLVALRAGAGRLARWGD